MVRKTILKNFPQQKDALTTRLATKVMSLSSLFSFLFYCFASEKPSSHLEVFWKISKNSSENACAEVSFLNKDADWRTATLLKVF